MDRLGKYEFLEETGHGGFATVYTVRDPSLGQVVAVKVLHGGYTDRSKVVQLSPQNRTLGRSTLRHRTPAAPSFRAQILCRMPYRMWASVLLKAKFWPYPRVPTCCAGGQFVLHYFYHRITTTDLHRRKGG
jgi:serine/threonine protein kinase